MFLVVFHVKHCQSGAMIDVGDLTGLWTRRLIAWPDGKRDETTRVGWLQAAAAYADLRQPAWPQGRFKATCLDRLTMAECHSLAEQQGFAGVLERRGAAFEWVRIIDFQPPQPARDIGRLFWQDDVLVEEGVEAAYTEHWYRDPAAPRAPSAAVHLRDAEDGRWGCLLRAGDVFMLARDRQAPVAGASLAEAVAGAATLRAAQRLVDFEISLGRIEGGIWRIARSSLPFRVGAEFSSAPRGATQLDIAGVRPDGGAASRRWEIAGCWGDTSTLLNVNRQKL
jgi:hypothetical protein